MDFPLLHAAAARQPLFLHRPDEVRAFEDMRSKGLVAGTVRGDAHGRPCAVLYCLTPDGRALLAMTRFMATASTR